MVPRLHVPFFQPEKPVFAGFLIALAII